MSNDNGVCYDVRGSKVATYEVSYLGNPHWVSLTQWVGQNDQFGSDPMEQSLIVHNFLRSYLLAS